MNVEKCINKIIEKTGITKEEVNILVENKIKELKGLIKRVGVLYIIATKDLNIDEREFF